MKYKRIFLVIPLLLFTSSTIINAEIHSEIKPVPQVEFKPYYETYQVFVTPDRRPAPVKPSIDIPDSKAIIENVPTEKPVDFILDNEVSWYGPGFYGRRTACGLAYTKKLLGVAHRKLPCGTKVTFKWKDVILTVPVIDRGPYVDDRQWDLSGGLCVALDHCFTGPIYYKVQK